MGAKEGVQAFEVINCSASQYIDKDFLYASWVSIDQASGTCGFTKGVGRLCRDPSPHGGDGGADHHAPFTNKAKSLPSHAYFTLLFKGTVFYLSVV